MNNPEWNRVYLSLGSALLFFVLMVVALFGMDCMQGGCAIAFVSIFLVISSFAVALLFWTRAKEMDDILAGKHLLVHWVYPQGEAQDSAAREYKDYMENNRALLYIVGGFLVIAMLIMAIFFGEPGLMTAGILFVVLIIVAIVSVVAPKLEYRRALGASREAYITDRGIIYEGAVYPFKSFMMRMTEVRFMNATKKHPALLVFSFIQLVGLYIPRPFDISIPVPSGEEEKARSVTEKFNGIAEQEDNPVEPDKVCTGCGAYVKSGRPFCEACGASVGGKQELHDSSVTCPGCGARVNVDAKFCGSCGYKLK